MDIGPKRHGVSPSARLLLTIALLLPATILLIAAVMAYRSSVQTAREQVLRVAQTLGEHALRTLRAQVTIVNAVDAYLGARPWSDIARSRDVHDFLVKMQRSTDDVNTVFAIGPNGRTANSSLRFPFDVDVRQREFFIAAQAQLEPHISAPDVGRINGRRFFSFTQRRSSPDGSFNGIVSVSVNPSYFENFYRSILESNDDVVALIRGDGTVLARTAGSGNTVQRVPAGTGLLKALETNANAGTWVSKGISDGQDRLYGYQRVADFPAYVVYGMSEDAAVWAEWRKSMIAYGLAGMATMLVLLAAAWMLQRQAGREREAIARYASESARREAAEQISRSKDEFLAALSHELRNPLAAITTSAHLLDRTAGPDALMRHAIGVVLRQSKQMDRLLRDVFQTAQAVYSKVELHRVPVSLLDEARAIAFSFTGYLSGQVQITVNGEDAVVSADPIRLRQMIGNLLDNSEKYGSSCVDIDISTDGEDGVLTVTDNGDGIPPELLPRLFEPFVQGEQALERPKGGLGLGLALVQRLTAQHGGRVSAHSAGPGRGSVFRIRLPLTGARVGASPPASPERPVAARRVLVIDDNEDARDSLRALLELDGHEVRVAADGPEGLEQLDAFTPDVVLVDIGLPGMDGYEWARQAVRRPVSRKPRLVALSGYGSEQDRRLARAAGFERHITKPPSSEDLRAALA